MTGASRDRILKDVNSNISDHLRNHIHLTNCIHLKNHIHKHSPAVNDRILMRDLVVLQRSRSLKDPSASPRFIGDNVMSWKVDHPQDGKDLAHHVVSRPFEFRETSVEEKGGSRQNRAHKFDSDKLKDIASESDDAALSCNHNEVHARVGKIAEFSEANTHGDGKRVKRRKFRGERRNRPFVATMQNAEAQNEMSVASNSFSQGRDSSQKYRADVTDGAGNVCGIPWNWSRIHQRGKKSVFDMSSSSDGELSLPLLLDTSGSQGSRSSAFHHDYSGELGIFAGNLLKRESDSDLASEGRSKHGIQKQQSNSAHENLTQKYMPRKFGDLVGQSLVVQALSNAITRRKIGLLYVFHGPHGTGKTTCARIFARSLNCHSIESHKPCGCCDSCIAHERGKSRTVTEIGPVSKIDFEAIIGALDNNSIASRRQSQYRVFIFDECDTLSSDCWGSMLKVIDRAPRGVVFILVCSSLDVLPHVIVSRSQKFFFTKLKDVDILCKMEQIASEEDLEIDRDALKLIASRSEGSLRDAEMTLEQLSLLGQRISLCLVQELVGLISDEKLVDLLDLALSADTVNTVKNLRHIMESGVEPLTLMSQLATVITDILAGSYDVLKERPRRKFFQRKALTKEDMEKLRQALKTLSEAEKQLRMSNDRMTWLTAALLQLAPDQQYYADNSLDHSHLAFDNSFLKSRSKKSNGEMRTYQDGISGDIHCNNANKLKVVGKDGKGHVGGGVVSQRVDTPANGVNEMDKVQLPGKFREGIEEIWLEVLEEIPNNSLKEFMYHEGKLISISYGAAPTVQLLFNSQLTKSDAEKFRSQILPAFEAVLRSPVMIEIRCESRKPIILPPLQKVRPSHSDREFDMRNSESEFVGEMPTMKTHTAISFPDQRKLSGRDQSLALVRKKATLAHVIQHGSLWSRHKPVSIAEKLERENLRLEPRSRGVLCWNPPKLARFKLSRLKIRRRKPKTILKLVACGRCLPSRSPR